jgi:hypothetical protein
MCKLELPFVLVGLWTSDTVSRDFMMTLLPLSTAKASGAGCVRLALDFLPRPATMTRRQHSGTGFSIGQESPLGDCNPAATRDLHLKYGRALA